MSIQVYPAAMKINGDSGYTNLMCIRGPEGPQGVRGIKGEKGDGLQIDGSVQGSTADLPDATTHAGETWLVVGFSETDGYWSDGTNWQPIGEIKGPKGDPGINGSSPTLSDVNVSVGNTVGTPSATGSFTMNPLTLGYDLNLTFDNLKGEPGTPAGFGQSTASISEDGGEPSCVITATGSNTNKAFNFAFKNIIGPAMTYNDLTPAQKAALKGPKGDPLTFNDLTPAQKEELRGEPGPGIGELEYAPLVLISNQKPNNPINNLLYVHNSSYVQTGFITQIGYDNTTPSYRPDGTALQTGDIYIRQAVKSNAHPLVWGSIVVYPIRVWMWNGSTWVAKEAECYVNNAWYPLNTIWFIDSGKIVSSYSCSPGTSVNQWNVKETSNGVQIRCAARGTTNITFGEAIDTSEYPCTLVIEGTMTAQNNSLGHCVVGGMSSLGGISTTVSGTTLPDTTVYNNFSAECSGNGYPGFGIIATAPVITFDMTITNLFLLFDSDIPA